MKDLITYILRRVLREYLVQTQGGFVAGSFKHIRPHMYYIRSDPTQTSNACEWALANPPALCCGSLWWHIIQPSTTTTKLFWMGMTAAYHRSQAPHITPSKMRRWHRRRRRAKPILANLIRVYTLAYETHKQLAYIYHAKHYSIYNRKRVNMV